MSVELASLIVRVLYVAGYALAGVVDLRERRIPNVVTYPLLVLALVARPEGFGLVPWQNLAAAALTSVAFVALAARGWMGMGDVKLAALIALASGPALAAVTLWLAFLAGALVGLALIAAQRLARGAPLPFGPFLALAGILAALAPALLLGWSPFRGIFG